MLSGENWRNIRNLNLVYSVIFFCDRKSFIWKTFMKNCREDFVVVAAEGFLLIRDSWHQYRTFEFQNVTSKNAGKEI